ncbi:MAG TPA: bifunctional 2-polyprenyl-6-hydroxyphenol methylase/3-demethylubiquinol 3-O-methyltransferase UbiG [Xanthobacteraceae bacterium]|nr:bifunctional 2-polyprenyl-6-hydroxyphenol methylase/3-demethylubiquinol 3-O-methyltransferase UbiG [Xanthobacteraceae bacterium]
MVNDSAGLHTTVDRDEVARFAALADDWWNPRGKMAPLHKFNPVRLGFIRDQACAQFGRDAKMLDCLQGLTFLDVGCGGGIVAEPLARLGGKVTGIDPAEENVEAARLHAAKSGLAVDYRTTTVEALAETKLAFDVVIASEVVEHVADLDFFVGRSAALVKPKGLMIVTTINRTLKSFAFVIVGAEYILRWLPVGTHCWDKFVSPQELDAALSASGLAVVEESGIQYDPFRDQWHRSDDMDVNYMLAAEKRGA